MMDCHEAVTPVDVSLQLSQPLSPRRSQLVLQVLSDQVKVRHTPKLASKKLPPTPESRMKKMVRLVVKRDSMCMPSAVNSSELVAKAPKLSKTTKEENQRHHCCAWVSFGAYLRSRMDYAKAAMSLPTLLMAKGTPDVLRFNNPMQLFRGLVPLVVTDVIGTLLTADRTPNVLRVHTIDPVQCPECLVLLFVTDAIGTSLITSVTYSRTKTCEVLHWVT